MYHFRKLREREVQSGRPPDQETGVILGRQIEGCIESTGEIAAMQESQLGSNVLDLNACRQQRESIERAEVFQPHLGTAPLLFPPMAPQRLRRHASLKGQRVHMVKRPARAPLPIVDPFQTMLHSLMSPPDFLL